MKTRLLYTPGPVPIHEQTLLDMAAPIIHHRAPEYSELLEKVRNQLKQLFGTEQEVILLGSSGTGAMEAAVTNLLCPGDHALVIDSGKFGERWTEICESYGVKPTVIKVPWGEPVDPAQVEQALNEDHSIKAVYSQASETSTGVRHPVEKLASLVKDRENTILVVDAITGLGVFPLPMDEIGIDVIVSGSQKALALPPGLALIALSQKAWRMNETSTLPRYYFDLAKEYKAVLKNQSAYTPPVSLVVGLSSVLDRYFDEGLDNLYNRTHRMAKAVREAAKALGLGLFASSPSDAVTAIKTPEGIDAGKIVAGMRDGFNITVAGGQAQAKGKIFRIGMMGNVAERDAIGVIAALESVLADLGYEFQRGAGLRAASEALKE